MHDMYCYRACITRVSPVTDGRSWSFDSALDFREAQKEDGRGSARSESRVEGLKWQNYAFKTAELCLPMTTPDLCRENWLLLTTYKACFDPALGACCFRLIFAFCACAHNHSEMW